MPESLRNNFPRSHAVHSLPAVAAHAPQVPRNQQAQPQFQATVTAEEMRLRAILHTINAFDYPDFPAPELRRARNMIEAHGTTTTAILATITFLESNDMGRQYIPGTTRRVALAALLGIAVGFDTSSAQRLVDKAREKQLKDVATFVMGEAFAVGVMAAAGYGAYLVTGKAAAGVTAKAAAIKTGAVGVGKGVLVMTGWVGLGVGAVAVGIAGVCAGADKADDVFWEHRDVLEPKFMKDQRILDGIKEGRVALPNHCPDPRRV